MTQVEIWIGEVDGHWERIQDLMLMNDDVWLKHSYGWLKYMRNVLNERKVASKIYVISILSIFSMTIAFVCCVQS